jgi:hypothetical protein
VCLIRSEYLDQPWQGWADGWARVGTLVCLCICLSGSGRPVPTGGSERSENGTLSAGYLWASLASARKHRTFRLLPGLAIPSRPTAHTAHIRPVPISLCLNNSARTRSIPQSSDKSVQSAHTSGHSRLHSIPRRFCHASRTSRSAFSLPPSRLPFPLLSLAHSLALPDSHGSCCLSSFQLPPTGITNHHLFRVPKMNARGIVEDTSGFGCVLGSLPACLQ